MTPVDPEDYGWIVAASLGTFTLWLPHLILSIRLWLHERKPRSFRGAYIAVMLQIGLLRIVLSAATLTWPDVGWINFLNLLTAPVLTAALISGAFVALYSWLQGDAAHW